MPASIMRLGAHMSISGGVEKSIYSGHSIGCTAIQIFTGSNRQWNLKLFAQEDIKNFEEAKIKYPMDVIAHASYLINLGSVSADTLKKSIDALKSEIYRCEQLSINYLVLHPGSGTSNENDTLVQIKNCLDEILQDTKNTTILLENTARQGNVVGYTFEQLAFLIEGLKHTKRVGVCFDTCHAWAAGYDFSSPEKYTDMWESFDKTIGLSYLKALHINDSQKPLGSHVDRHENIGKGTMGLESFRLIFNDERLFELPKVLETPKDKGLEEDIINLETIRNLISASTYKKIRTQ